MRSTHIFRLVTVIPVVLFLFACHAPFSSITTARTPRLDTTFKTTICNHPYKFQKPNYSAPTLIDLFQIRDTKTDSISFEFDDRATLKLTYIDSGITKQKVFPGRLTKKGYKIIFNNDRKEIPPLFPFIFARYNINHITLSLTRDNNFRVHNTWNQGGHILIFGGGDSGTRNSYFATSKTAAHPSP